MALVHRRLAIIDLPGGGQPMANEDGTVQVVFNGEIYNHTLLRQQLRAAGHRFTSDHSDTEVLVHGWEQWGTELPFKLLGMFAFAIWDSNADTLFLARDRLGQKPLFYASLEDGLVFGSTIPAVLAWPEVPRRVPREQINLYLLLGYLPAPHTIYRDISQVEPGHWIRLRQSVLDGAAFWSCPSGATGESPDDQNAAASLRALLSTAVESQLIADVPIACFLSGGIDSSIIAALMQQGVSKAGGPPIHTVSVGFSESDFDESPFAETVARHIGSHHRKLHVSIHHEVVPTLQRLMHQSLGQPFGDSSILPTSHLSKAVRALAPVALSGDGGDEMFAGYDRYRGLALLQRFSWLLKRLPPAVSRRERYRRLAYAARGSDMGDQYTRLTSIFPMDTLEELWDGPAPQWEPEVGSAINPIRYAMARDQRHYLPGDVLWKVDSAAMACALEVRSPMLDHLLVEFTARLSPRQLIHGQTGKWLLRQAFRDLLPPEIMARGKQGFGVPIGDWFRGALRDDLHDLVLGTKSFCSQHFRRPPLEKLLAEHASGRRDHTHRLFSLLMLELWWLQAGPTAVE